MVVTPGTYSESVVLTRSGDAAAPIVVRALPGALLACFEPWSSRAGIDVRQDVAHIVVQGFELVGGFGESVLVRPGAHDIELSGLNIHDNRTGIWIAGAHHVTIGNSWIHDNAGVGVRLFGGARDVQVLDTRAQDNDDGLGCAGDADGFSADATTADLRFERVEASGNSEDGFDLQTPHVAVVRAVIRNNGCSGLKLWAGGYLENTLIEGNRIGVNASAPPGSTTTVQNCTLADNAIGVRALGRDHTVTVQNSVITGPGKALNYATTVWLRERYNILYRPLLTDALIVPMGAENERRYSGNDINSGIWQQESGQGEQTMAQDPRLDPLTRQPQPESAAIDSGGAEGSPAVDLIGVARPVGAGIDRGVFEWVPVESSARLRRATLRTRADGSGRLSLQAEVTLPPSARFDPSANGVMLSVEGDRGNVLQVGVAPQDWSRRGATVGQLLRMARTDAAGHRVVLLLQAGLGRVLLSLHAESADLSALSGGALALTIDSGAVHVTASGPLRNIGRALALR